MSNTVTTQSLESRISDEREFPMTSKEDIVQWASRLPVAAKLSELLPDSLQEVANLTHDRVKEISRQFSASLEDVISVHVATLKTALGMKQKQEFNSKFNIYQGNFGTISDFHQKSLYEEIGAPNPKWEVGMEMEHTRNTVMFTTGNYHITTCPADEWAYVIGKKTPQGNDMVNGRNIKRIDYLMNLELTKSADLSRPEVLAVVMYTGPMFQVYNTVLRKYPPDIYAELKSRDSLFPTTICVLVSAVQKIARKMKLEPGKLLYRGVDGNMEFPRAFIEPDENGCFGMMEPGFLSTTSHLPTAVTYSRADQSKAPKVFRITVGTVDRGADISLYSQYSGEAECLYVPRSFLQPVMVPELMVTEAGVVQLQDLKVNANLKTVTIEEYEKRKKDLHMASFKVLLQDLQDELNNKVRENLAPN